MSEFPEQTYYIQHGKHTIFRGESGTRNVQASKSNMPVIRTGEDEGKGCCLKL